MKKMIFLCAIIINIYASDYSKGIEHIENKEYEEAGSFFLDLYLKDDIGSNSYMGELYAYHYKDKEEHCNGATYFLFQGIKEGDCRSLQIISNLYRDRICLKGKQRTAEELLIKSNKYKNKYASCMEGKNEKNK